MATQTVRNTKTDVYQEVTDRIIAELEAGALPWVRDWNGTTGSASCRP